MYIINKILNLYHQYRMKPNSPELLQDIKTTLANVRQKNLAIVGKMYSTAGFDNEGLVSDTVYFADECLEYIKGQHSDAELVKALLTEITSRKRNFERSRYDPDGIVIGTLIDIETALKAKFSI